MNERIRELAEHCDFYVGNEHYDKSHEEQQRLWAEKLAELIVRECMEQVRGQYLPVMEDKEMMKDTRWDGYVQCGVDSVVAIREYFGVEE